MSEGVERLVLAIRDLWSLQRWRRRDGDGGCSLTGQTLLHLLHTGGAARVSDLAASARIDVSVASRQVSQLEQHGLVERVTDPADGRSHLVQLTPAGEGTHEDLRTAQLRQVAEALDGWSAQEIDELAGSLERLGADLVASELFRFSVRPGVPTHITKASS